MKIVYYVHDLNFPLREGVRKQAWILANEIKKKGFDVEIISSSNKRRIVIKNGIKIKYGGVFGISHIKTDIIHYINHPSPFILPLLMFSKTKKQIMTMFDGNLNGFWKRLWTPLLRYYINLKIDYVTLQTNFQERIYRKTGLKVKAVKILPFISKLKKKKNRSKKPSLLVITHLSKYKGIYNVLEMFKILRKRIDGLTLIIADSGIRKNRKSYKHISKINKGDIILKKYVDVNEEMAKAWVYLYPVLQPQETFSIPLSLIEAIQTGTPYISTFVGGIPEYFDKVHLIKPNNTKEMVLKVIELIKKPCAIKLKKEIDNKKIADEYLKLYKSIF